jgi:hypothetical protein
MLNRKEYNMSPVMIGGAIAIAAVVVGIGYNYFKNK